MSTILVIEDDPSIRQGITDCLTLTGYTVISAGDGREGMDKAQTATCDLILLDLVLPHHSGFEILETLKKNRPGQPVIILSARGEENDRVRGLTLGADDYVVKPFSARELLARVNAVLRRSSERQSHSDTYQIGTTTADLNTATLTHDNGTTEQLSEKETQILHLLLTNRGRPVTREELLRHVWGIENKILETRTIDMHIAHLRKKLRAAENVQHVRPSLGEGGDKPSAPELLETIRGKGYQIT